MIPNRKKNETEDIKGLMIWYSLSSCSFISQSSLGAYPLMTSCGVIHGPYVTSFMARRPSCDVTVPVVTLLASGNEWRHMTRCHVTSHYLEWHHIIHSDLMWRHLWPVGASSDVIHNPLSMDPLSSSMNEMTAWCNDIMTERT